MRQLPADTLRAALDSVFAAPKYQWVERTHPWRWLLDRFLRLVEWFVLLRSGHAAIYWTITAAALVTLVAILVHAGWLMARTMRHATPPDARAAPDTFERRDGAWYRARAVRAAAAGRYAEAMRAYFEGVILDLAAAGKVQWHPSKTPREYTRERKLSVTDRERLRVLVDGVYEASFAGAAVGAPEWERWRADAGAMARGT